MDSMPYKPGKKRYVLAGLFIFFLLSGMASLPPLMGGPAPDFKLETVEGENVRLSDLKGNFVVLNFWATWCGPCTKEMPELQKAHQSLKDHSIKIIGVNLAESRSEIDEFARSQNLNFPLLLDHYGDVAQDYEVRHLPVTYFITPDGMVEGKFFGGGLTRETIEKKIAHLQRASATRDKGLLSMREEALP